MAKEEEPLSGNVLNLNQDLAGWKIEQWYELRFSTNETRTNAKIGGYFKYREFALEAGKGKGRYREDGWTEEVWVLTDGQGHGHIVGKQEIDLGNEREIEYEARLQVVEKLKKMLTPEEIKLLNLR